ncbi:MAG: ArsR/SmtB family transcription factor [Nitriliruptoraceae bacterium]
MTEVAPAADRTPADTPESGLDLPARVALFRALADPTRLAVLELLAATDSRCHCDLEAALDVPASRLSFHLKVLRDAELVGTTRRGRWAHYHLLPGALARLRSALPSGQVPLPSAASRVVCASPGRDRR